MTPAEIDALKTAARYRVALLQGAVPPELGDCWNRLIDYMLDCGVGLDEAQTRLALWLTEHVPALGDVPALIVRRDGAAGVAQVERVFRGHDAYF